ncbi:hypothetical protein ASF41_14815 [Methylobacterium sp. Leaf111]|uniref:hypothetical protein n=1 Tax=Methylobacterium sp. Leaf111 TaxID=1736257 RepID=UPI0006FC1BAC|nr:hypothetical protein [Methylobacterium sp. Leaf111]KQP75724.1 hypothetical protein ASF41_14815 [Methylobacterium sp. Leaf111]
MKRSKLEAYYEQEFGPRDDEPDDRPLRRSSGRDRAPARPRGRRGGFGIVRLLKVTLMLGPMTILLAASLLMDCQGGVRGSWVPDILRSTACARRDLAGRVLHLDSDLRTVTNGLR